MKQVLGAFPNHCSRMGSKGYKHIPFPFYSDEEFQKQQQQQQQQQPQSAEVPSPESNHDYNVGMASQQIQANGPLTTTADSGATGWGVVEPNNDQAVTTNNMGQQGQGLPGTNSYQNGFSSIPQYQQGDANSFNGWVPPHQQNGLLNAPNANFMGNNGWPSAQQSQIFGNNQQVPYGQQGYYDGGVVQNQQIESPSSAYDDGWIP